MTTTPDTNPFKGEIRIVIDAPSLASAGQAADRVMRLDLESSPHVDRVHAVYVVDENGDEIEGA